MVKRLPVMQETQARSLGQEDPLEKEMASHSSILAWRILWTEESGRLQSTGSQTARHDGATSLFVHSLWLQINIRVSFLRELFINITLLVSNTVPVLDA